MVGRELAHSLSPEIWSGLFNALPDTASVRRSYSLFPLPEIAGVRELVATHPDLRGFNVTIPYKEDVLLLLDGLTAEARAIQAVNTVRVDRRNGEPRLIGHNTDAPGFLSALRRTLGIRPLPEKALVLGTGGAAKAVVYALRSHGVTVTAVSRRPTGDNCIGYDALTGEVMAQHSLIVNATPLGMSPHTDTAPDIPYDLIGPGHVLFDLVYNHAVTRFMEQGSARGAVVSNGMSMLREQAREALRFFIKTS